MSDLKILARRAIRDACGSLLPPDLGADRTSYRIHRRGPSERAIARTIARLPASAASPGAVVESARPVLTGSKGATKGAQRGSYRGLTGG